MLYLGTTNPGKVREFAGILAPLGIEIRTASLNVPETADTFEGNARQKALAYAAHTGGVTVSEDSGLVVSAFNGLPGPWSARFADCTLEVETRMVASSERSLPRRVTALKESGKSREEIDHANNELVLDLLREIPQPYRAARFVVHLIVARPREILFEARGDVSGWIAEEARGFGGFGYDPIFVGHDTFGKTYAELDSVRKNLRSHRKRVLADFGLWVAMAVREGVVS